MADSSILSESTSIRGKIRGDGDLEIRGRVEGEVAIGGELIIAEGALLRASLQGTRVVIRGAVLGDVSASEAIVLEESARVVGNLTADRIAIALGAQIRGELHMDVALEKAEKSDKHEARRPAAATRPAPAVSRPAAPPVRREPMPPARSVVVTRKAPEAVASSPTPPPTSTAPAAPKAPPAPVVPAIKKGAKAAPKKKTA